MKRKARSTDRKKIEAHYAPKSVSEVNDRTTIESNRRMSGELDRHQRPQCAHTYLHMYITARDQPRGESRASITATSVRLVTRVRGRTAYYEETHVTHERRVTIVRQRSLGSRWTILRTECMYPVDPTQNGYPRRGNICCAPQALIVHLPASVRIQWS